MLSNERKENAIKLALAIPGQETYPPILEATIKSIEKDIKNTVNDAHTIKHLEEQKEIAKVKLEAVLQGLLERNEQTTEEEERLGGERVQEEAEDDADVRLPGSETIHGETPGDSEDDV